MTVSEKITNVMKNLKEIGYESSLNEHQKNGVTKDCMYVNKEGDIWAVFYLDVLESMKEEEIMDYILKALNDESVSIDPHVVEDVDYIMKNIHIGLQPESNENLVTRKSPFEGIMEYLFFFYNSTYSINLTPQIFDFIKEKGFSEDEIWDTALQHTCEDAVIGNIQDMMYEDLGVEAEKDELLSPLCVITSKSRIRGAACILNKELIKNYAENFELDEFYMIPSSVHEVIVIPATMPKEDADKMVMETNANAVSDDIRLGNEVFLVDVAEYVA